MKRKQVFKQFIWGNLMVLLAFSCVLSCEDGGEYIVESGEAYGGADYSLPTAMRAYADGDTDADTDADADCPLEMPTFPDPAFCTDETPCCEGQGDCDGIGSSRQCKYPLICVEDVGADFDLPADYDVCLYDTCDAFDPGSPDPDFCSSGCPCALGEGDCDYEGTSTHCEGDLVCGTNNGSAYGLPSSYDVCECPVFDVGSPSLSFCSEDCPCGLGEGHCENDNECDEDLECGYWAGAEFGLPDGYNACECPGFDPNNLDGAFCTEECPCGHGEGDCDDETDSTDCQGDLVCGHNNGAQFGMPAEWDVCVCPSFDPNNLDGAFCTEECPCGHGEGDCDDETNSTDCQGDLVCGHNNGAQFGMPAEWDVCVCPSFDPNNLDSAFCTEECPCGHGEGDCDDEVNSTDCQGDLVCGHNNGAQFGMPDAWDVCVF